MNGKTGALCTYVRARFFEYIYKRNHSTPDHQNRSRGVSIAQVQHPGCRGPPKTIGRSRFCESIQVDASRCKSIPVQQDITRVLAEI